MFRFWARKYVRHLEQEIEYLRGQAEHERQRAERALDELLRVRTNIGPITVPTPREVEQAETVIEKMVRDSEFSLTGNADAAR